MLKELRPSILVLAVLSIVTGVMYPALITGIAALAFPRQANGSLLTGRDGQVVGSRLIGQQFSGPRYFWGRLSATAPAYNASASSGSNYGPLNPALDSMVRARIAALRAADPGNSKIVPVDLVTASGSGLDPEISPASARYQVPRVARSRGLSDGVVRALVAGHTSGRTFGVLGEPRVNVLLLNLALDSLKGWR
ncbi:MAG TPA: potassium-transporting ATPase subunit KdpC [Gemmatimonadales bacterium]|jgi:K+-transporting ATPase ATPase C chain